MLAVVLAPGLALASTFVLLIHARQQYAISVAKARERQGKDSETIARLREDVLFLKAELVSTSARNGLLIDENKRHRTDSQSMQEKINSLSEIIRLDKQRLSGSNATITERAADIAQLESKNAELEALLLTAYEEQDQNKFAINGLEDRVMGLEIAIRARDEQIARLTEVGASHSKEVAQIKEDKDGKIRDLQDRVSECHSQLLIYQQSCSLREMVFKHRHEPSSPRSEPSRRASLESSEYRNNPWGPP